MVQGAANEFATEIARIAQELLAQPTMQRTLDRVTQLAVETIPGCDHAGILLVHPGGRVETAAATSQLVVDSNKAQEELREGPSFDAAWTHQTYRVIHMGSEKRWPRYVPKALELGIGSMIGFSLFAAEDRMGALDLYSQQPYGFSVDSEQKGWVFASHAGVALKGARRGEGDEREVS